LNLLGKAQILPEFDYPLWFAPDIAFFYTFSALAGRWNHLETLSWLWVTSKS